MTPHPGKDGREPLTREKILSKAIEMIDADGVKGLSMRRLGDALGVEAMAMYHYFPNKEAILDGIVTQLMADAHPQLGPSARDWKEAMVLGLAVRRGAIEAHPKVGPLFLGRQSATPASLEQFEAPLALLHSAGFRGQDLADAAHAIFAYAAGWLILASGEGGTWSGPTAEDVMTAPEAAPVAASLATELRDWNHGFDEGLMALLDGLEARMGPA